MIYLKVTYEPLSEDETALNAAIADAAGLELNECKHFTVASIEVDTASPNSKTHELHKNADNSGGFHQDSSNNPNIVSALLVSERKFSGTESVQISEKLINREN